MANLYRLIVGFILSFASYQALALIPTDKTWSLVHVSGCSGARYTFTDMSLSALSQGLLALAPYGCPYHQNYGPATFDANGNITIVNENPPSTFTLKASSRPICPANSSPFGEFCSCNAGYSENADTNACESVSACPVGNVSQAEVTFGWFKVGLRPTSSPPATRCIHDSGTASDPKNTYCLYDVGDGARYPTGDSVNGYLLWKGGYQITSTGATCGAATVDPETPAPACEGDMGMVNGTMVCLAGESQAAKDARAAQAASAAASAARAAAIAAGKTEEQAAAAAAAAAIAAATSIRNGGSPADAAAAGAAAGAAHNGSTIEGSTPAEAADLAARIAGARASAASGALASAAVQGIGTPTSTAAATAAGNAAAAAVGAGLSNAAAAAAGNAAAAVILGGGTSGEAANAGAGAAGGVTGQGTSTGTNGEDGGSISQFCKLNPDAEICQNKGKFSGTCGAAPACEGDAVLCAVAKATFQTNCALSMPETSAEQAAYALAATKTGDQTGALEGNETKTFGPGDFDQTELLGGAVGMHDVTINVHGTSINIPFSSVNPYLANFGRLLVAVTFLVCAMIVGGFRSAKE